MNYPLFWDLIENVKKKPQNICKRTLDKRFEWDWLVGLGAMLGDGHTENWKKKSSFSDFPGKIDSVMFFGFECAISRTKLLKPSTHFWENRNV